MAKTKTTRKTSSRNKVAAKAGPRLKFRYRWVCFSGHTAQKTGPYVSSYAAARRGADWHDEAEHQGRATAIVEISMKP